MGPWIATGLDSRRAMRPSAKPLDTGASRAVVRVQFDYAPGHPMASVGLIVNTSASRDVRRLTSLARTVSVHERVNAVARILCGLLATKIDTVFYMAERAHVVERAVEALAASGTALDEARLPRLCAVQPDEADDAAGTTRAAAAMAMAGVACVITVGGDGTHRAAANGQPGIVLLPLPGGTNNAFATSLDPTAAGLAAGLYAAAPDRYVDHVRQATRLEVRVGDGHAWDGPAAIALVDVAVLEGGSVGARAIWDPTLLQEAVVARSDPTLTGLAGIGGMLHPIDDGILDPAAEHPHRGLHITFGPSGRLVAVPLGPGQLVATPIRSARPISLGEPVVVAADRRDRSPRGQVTLAFDGERDLVLAPGETAEVRLTERGPRVLDAANLLRAAARDGAFFDPPPGGRR